MSEEMIFNGGLDQTVLEAFNSTPDKINYCLEKGVFYPYFRNRFYTGNEIESANFKTLDLKIFNEIPFEIDNFYETGDYTIALRSDAVEEILYAFDDQIQIWQHDGEINFHLETFLETKDKLKYLRKVIKNNNPFKTKELPVRLEYHTKNLRLDHAYEYDFLFKAKDYALDYLYGKVALGMMFDIRAYPKMKELAHDYATYIKAKNSYSLITQLKQGVRKDYSEVEKKTKYQRLQAFESVYFLEKLGMIKEMRDAGLSKTRIYEIVGSLVKAHPKVIEEKLKLCNLLDKKDISTEIKNRANKIDKIIQEFK